MSKKELQELRSILKRYLQENSSIYKASDNTCLQSDIKALQQKETDKFRAEMMKQHQIITYT